MTPFDAVIIGGGPAGAAIATLLASWHYSVLIVAKSGDRRRGLAESLPPSTRKILDRIGALADVDGAGFYRTTGNTVWWGSPEQRIETFGTSHDCQGYQVFRPDLDRALLRRAALAGATVRRGHVHSVQLSERDPARVEYEHDGRRASVSGQFVVDCSGRAGVLARRYRQPERTHRACALIGTWRHDGWQLPDETHTLVEAYEDGWAWSIPLSPSLRQVGAMIGPALPRATPGRRTLSTVYRAELAKSSQIAKRLRLAQLQRVWACDASLYSSQVFGGPQFLLVGDAATFIDPLSSFGVKKALTSAWLGAIAVNTCLTDRGRQTAALDFFAHRERLVYASSLQRTREFATTAHARHPRAFWHTRATRDDTQGNDVDDLSLMRDPSVQSVFRMFKELPSIELTLAGAAAFEKQPMIRGNEIVVDDAVVLRSTECRKPVRFVCGVDLVRLADMACHHSQIPDLFETYCRTLGRVALPNFLGSLSLLVANQVLTTRHGLPTGATEVNS